jgi:hypothetical protein
VTEAEAELRAEVLAAASGHILARAIHVALALDLADRFENGARCVRELAVECGAAERALRRILHFLARHGYFEERDGDLFALTARGAMLRSEAPSWTADVIRSLGHPGVWEAFGDLEAAVRNGRGREERRGPALYEPSGDLPHEVQFSRAMAGYHAGEPEAVATHYDFARYRSVVDIGGSGGVLISEILLRYPQIRATIFDRPGLAAHAMYNLRASSVDDRSDFHGGNFFDAVPGGADLYILSHILHDWPDSDARRILRSCRAAMGRESRLLVLEALTAPGGAGESEIPADVLLLANTDGRLRTAEEHRALLESAELRLTRIVPCGPRVSAVEAEPA